MYRHPVATLVLPNVGHHLTFWQFRVRNDSLTGELRLLDNTRFREVRTVRAP